MKEIDENYFKNDAVELTSIEQALAEGEQILWRGKPKKKAFVWGNILSMMPVALIWLLFDAFFIGIIVYTNKQINMPWQMILFYIAFFAFHLMPVWIWITKIVTANRQYKNLEYAFTNKRIIVKSGIIGIDIKSLYYSEIDSFNLKVGLIDKILKVGDIYISSKSGAQVLYDIENPYVITQKLQQIVVDIKTDIQFPNNLRPESNDGYNTKYTKDLW